MFSWRKAYTVILCIALGAIPFRGEAREGLPSIVHYPTPYWNTDGETATIHISVAGVPVATVEVSAAGSSTLFWNHADRLGSTRAVTDGSGAIAEAADYDPFGKILSNTSVAGHREQRKFTGHEFDPKTEYTYANARYLDTESGRFLSQDPTFWNIPKELLFDPQQLNSYAYARNNPLKFVDRDGKKVELAARPVFGAGTHHFFLITPDQPNEVHITGLPTGTTAFTFGGYNRGGILGIGNKLRPDIGYEDDPTPNNDLSYLTGNKEISDRIEIIPPSGQSDSEFINTLGQAYDRVNAMDDQKYFFGGQAGVSGRGNSNNFVYELGSQAGVGDQISAFNSKGWAPGSNRGLPQGNTIQYIQQKVSSIKSKIEILLSQLQKNQ
ncbi:MAG: RHS repeat-associated core domain-containing protein [Patescibacteria group bacterium]